MKHRVSSGEHGATIVLLALSLVALLAVAGLAVDGGALYADRRQVQNAADAAAMAGARAFNQYLLNPLDTTRKTAIRDAVIAKATENRAVDDIVCRLVDISGNDLQDCPTSSSDVISPLAAGVRAQLRDRQATTFMRVVGISEFRASADAAATVQRAVRGIATPFLVCGRDALNGGQNGMAEDGKPLAVPTPLLLDANPLLSPTDPDRWIINPAAVGKRYEIHDQHVPGCRNQSEGFKGWAEEGEESNQLPGWWGTQTGDRAGPARSVIAGQPGCTGGQLDNCVLVIPLCVDSNGQSGTNLELYCVRLGAFRIIDTGSGNSGNSHDGIFVGEAILSEGQGGGLPIPGEARLIKLIK